MGARDDMLQDVGHTILHPPHLASVRVFHITSHSISFSALSTSVLASASSFTQCLYCQPIYNSFPRHSHTFISRAAVLLKLPLLSRRRIITVSARWAYKIPNLKLSRGHRAAKSLPGIRKILILVVFVVYFLDWEKKNVNRIFLYLQKRVSQVSGFSSTNGLGDKLSFITTDLHQLAVYGEQ